MKHHVILLQDSVMLQNVYLTSEYNLTYEGNDIPVPGLVDEWKRLTINEIKTALRGVGFLEIFSTVQQADEHGKIRNIPIGQCSLVELLLAGTAVITIFWFDTLGLPINQTVYDLRIEEK